MGPHICFWDHAHSEIWAFRVDLLPNFASNLKIIFLEMGRVKLDNASLATYTRQQVEARLKGQYGHWFANQTQTDAVMKIWDDNYLQPGASDGDHMAWMQFAVDVKKSIFY